MNKRPLLLFIVFLMLGLFVKAQQISATTDRNKILIGEQVILTLKATDIDAKNTFIQAWFKIQDSTDHIQIIKTEAIDTIEVNGLTTYLQKVIITSFDSGKWVLPPIKLIIQNRTSGKQAILQTDPLTIEVLAVNVEGLTDYHDIKDILEVEVRPNYLLYAAIGLSAVIIAIISWLVLKRLKNKKPLPVPVPYNGTALQYALQQIKELQEEGLIAAGKTKLFYTRLMAVSRDYLQKQLQVRSPQATSDELMLLLGVYLQDEKKRTAFYQFLRSSDAVKFAKYIPGEEQNERAVETAIASLQYIDALTRNNKNNA